jgi:molecular chaperone GrpE
MMHDDTTNGVSPPDGEEIPDTPPMEEAVIDGTPGESPSPLDEGSYAEPVGLSLPDDPHEANEILIRELVEARQEAGELLDTLQRLAAEFDNYRKRTERDQVENVQRAGQRVITSLLPTLDSLDAALGIEAVTEVEVKMLEGMRGTEALLLDALRSEGFERIEAVGAPFDPALHEAVQVIPGEGAQVVEQELRKGYTMRGRVVRPSLVVVGHA